jgi:hypothetical protein
MPVLKQIFEARKEYRRCVPEDVGHHFARIQKWIPEEENVEFKERMVNCIADDNAWCNEKTFLYYEKENYRISHGVAMFGMDYPMDMLSLFISVFSLEDHDTHIMRFRLHPGKFMEEYKTLLTVTSIKRTHKNPDHPLLIRVDDFRKKVCKMLDAGKDK